MRQLQLIVLVALLMLMNACMIANYQVSAQESSEKMAVVASKDDEVVQFVIPRYYRFETRCRSGRGAGWIGLVGTVVASSCHEYRDFIGAETHDGVSMALQEMPLAKPIEFIEHIRSQGLACVVTVNEQINDDIPYGQILSAVTLLTVPVYTTKKYILSYSVLFDSKPVKQYRYHITEKAIFGWISWLLFPAMYPVWDDVRLNLTEYGPRFSVIKEATKTFLSEAHRDRIL